jgi:hypothetical protein
MSQRLPLIISVTALTVALVGSTPLGRAAESALDQVVPRAKRADFAANAGKLQGHKSSVTPRRGQIPVVGANGKLSPAIGAVGPAGPAGPTGPQGPAGTAGVSGYQRVTENVTVPQNSEREFGVSCPGGRAVFGGGYFHNEEFVDQLFVFESRPADSVWRFQVSNETQGNKAMTLYAVCASAS